MDHNITIGSKIKALRKENNMTLKQLGDLSGLSVGFLSQLERGISSIAIDSLAKIADILGVSLSAFFQDSENDKEDPVVRGFDIASTQINPQIIQYIMSNRVSDFETLPRVVHLMPLANEESESLSMYSHNGEEFVFILEGAVTVFVDDNRYILYPGDSIQIHSNQPHNWMNFTNKTAKFLAINHPNPFKSNSVDTLNLFRKKTQ